MCGIHGYLKVGSKDKELERVIQGMVLAGHHRGPDDEGHTLIEGDDFSVGFGHNRLSIIDLSEHGHQPMLDKETGNWITFNGEIYNFQDLKRELEQSGVSFSTQSDTELILKAYNAWGQSCVERFRGIFGFALWDAAREECILVRDQMGVKPLYFYAKEDRILFSSEVRSLLASDRVPKKLSMEGASGYLMYGCVQEPCTLVDHVYSVFPGTMLIVDKKGHIEEKRYWSLPQDIESDLDEATALKRVRSSLEDAIKYQQVSDVPIGVFLSGGIDSSVIASLACLQNPGKISTFCIGFEEKDFNESHYARKIADSVGSNHHELIMRGSDVRARWEEALAAYDQPSYDGLNTYFITELLAQHGLKVALSGLGGDEVFAGYNGFSKTLMVEKWHNRLRHLPFLLLSRFPWRATDAKLQTLLELSNPTLPASYFASRLLYNTANVEWLLQPFDVTLSENAWMERSRKLASSTKHLDAVNRASSCELQHYMLNQLLRDSDQMSMAHSLELRVPLLDHKLVEAVFNMPGSMKLDPSLQKPLLVRAMGKDLPSIAYEHPKQGFVFPFEAWFKKDLRPPIERFFKGSHKALWSEEKLRLLWSRFESGKLSWSRVWALFLLNDWLKRNKVIL